jgi:hypothetical protein
MSMVVLGVFCVQKREWISIKVALDGEGFGWWVVVAGRKTSRVFCSFKECSCGRERMVFGADFYSKRMMQKDLKGKWKNIQKLGGGPNRDDQMIYQRVKIFLCFLAIY